MNKEKQVVHCLCGRREQTFKQSKARRILAECPLLTCGSTKCEALLPIRPEGFIDIVSPTHNFWSHFYKQPDAEESAALQRARNIRDSATGYDLTPITLATAGVPAVDFLLGL